MHQESKEEEHDANMPDRDEDAGEEEFDVSAPARAKDTRTDYEKGIRPFFAVLSFLIALICLSVFIDRPLDFVSRLLVLFVAIIFGVGGLILLEQERLRKRTVNPQMDEQSDDDGDDIVETQEEEDSGEETLSPFELLVEEALASIPPEFQEKMSNLVVLVEDEPGEELLKHVGTEEGHTLLGLYQGVPLTVQGRAGTMLPERITIFQRTIEEHCHGDPRRIREQVRETVLHEVAHHFGMGHEEMPIWIK